MAEEPEGGETPDLVVVPAHVYQINGSDELLRDGTVVARNVDDFQVAYFFDADPDGARTPWPA